MDNVFIYPNRLFLNEIIAYSQRIKIEIKRHRQELTLYEMLSIHGFKNHQKKIKHYILLSYTNYMRTQQMSYT